MNSINSKPKKGSVKLLLTVLTIIGIGVLIVPFLLVPPASLDIQLTDRVFNTDLEGKKVRVTDADGYSREVSVYKRGENFIAHVGRVKSGESKWMVEMEDYQSVHFKTKIAPLDKHLISVKCTPVFGVLKVIARNAVKPDLPVLSELKITVAGKQYKGEPGADAVIYPIAPGKQEIKVEAAGYFPFTGEAGISVGTLKEYTVYLSPELSGNEIARMVLRWGQNPSDLDAHLALPKKANIDHVFYPSENKAAILNGQPLAMLDVDDTTSFGPETVTIFSGMDGRYTFAVYHYAGNGNLGMSGAVVEIYTKGSEKSLFKVPEYCQKRWWYVADLEINGSVVQIVGKNECLDQTEMTAGKK